MRPSGKPKVPCQLAEFSLSFSSFHIWLPEAVGMVVMGTVVVVMCVLVQNVLLLESLIKLPSVTVPDLLL